jgi:hypothetical protein
MSVVVQDTPTNYKISVLNKTRDYRNAFLEIYHLIFLKK